MTYKFNIDDPIFLFPASIWLHIRDVLITMECTHISDTPTCYLLHGLYPTKEGKIIISHGKSILMENQERIYFVILRASFYNVLFMMRRHGNGIIAKLFELYVPHYIKKTHSEC